MPISPSGPRHEAPVAQLDTGLFVRDQTKKQMSLWLPSLRRAQVVVKLVSKMASKADVGSCNRSGASPQSASLRSYRIAVFLMSSRGRFASLGLTLGLFDQFRGGVLFFR
jgi:hypothetical protein